MKLNCSNSTKNLGSKPVQLLIKSKCFHKHIIHTNNIQGYCSNCGLFAFRESQDKKFFLLTKPFSFSKDLAINPFDLILQTKTQYNLQTSQKKQIYKSDLLRLSYITHRINLILYIKKLTSKFKTNITTFTQAVEYMDIYINSLKNFPRDNDTLYTIAVASFVLSFKFCEANNPYEFEVIDYSHYPFDSQQLVKTENKILKVLQHDLFRITIYEICSNIKYCGFLLFNEINSSQLMKTIYHSIDQIIEEELIYNEDIIGADYLLLSFSLILYVRKKFKLKNSEFIINTLKSLYGLDDQLQQELTYYLQKFFKVEEGEEEETPNNKLNENNNELNSEEEEDKNEMSTKRANNKEQQTNLSSFKVNQSKKNNSNTNELRKNQNVVEINMKKIVLENKLNLRKIVVKAPSMKRNENSKNEPMSIRSLKLVKRLGGSKESSTVDMHKLHLSRCSSREKKTSIEFNFNSSAIGKNRNNSMLNSIIHNNIISNSNNNININLNNNNNSNINQLNNYNSQNKQQGKKWTKLFNVTKLNLVENKKLGKSKSSNSLFELGSINIKNKVSNSNMNNNNNNNYNKNYEPQSVKQSIIGKISLHGKKVVFPRIKYK